MFFQNLGIADKNEIHLPFSEVAKSEIDREKIKGKNSIFLQEFISEQILWEHSLYFTIQFYKFLIIETIIRNFNESHFWLHNYYYFTENLLKILESNPSDEFENKETNCHHLIETMLDILFLWLEKANENRGNWIYKNIIECIGNMVHYTTQCQYYGEKRKKKLINRILLVYCQLDRYCRNNEIEKIKIELENILLKPSGLTKPDHPYYKYIATTWEKFDKIPHYSSGVIQKDFDYFERLKNNVISKLNLDIKNY